MAVHTHPEAAFCSCKAFDIVAQDPHAMASSEQLKSSFAKQLSFAASHTEDCATHDHIPFDHTIVGFYSNHGCKPGRHPGTFKVKINQDHAAVSFVPGSSEQDDLMVLQVYDGHGPRGEGVSEFAARTLLDVLSANEENLRLDPAGALRRAVERVDELLVDCKVPCLNCGSTALVALVSRRDVHVACVGDSRCVLGKRASSSTGEVWHASDLSIDQKPDSPGEYERLKRAGALLVRMQGSMQVVHEVVTPYTTTRMRLSMSRALGDMRMKSCGVIAAPELTLTALDDEASCLLLASDGVWEVLSSQEAIDICRSRSDNATEACKLLIRTASEIWAREEGETRDDISAIVVFLPVIEKIAQSVAARVEALEADNNVAKAHRLSLCVTHQLYHRDLVGFEFENEEDLDAFSQSLSQKKRDETSEKLPVNLDGQRVGVSQPTPPSGSCCVLL